jgi:surface antigen
MSMPIKAIVFFVALVAWLPALPAQAQYLGLGLETNIELTKQDLDIIHHTVDTQVHGKAVGTTAKWSNPESGNSGKIMLTKKFTRNGQQCETLDYRLITRRRPVGPEHYVLSSCLQPDGQWRLI